MSYRLASLLLCLFIIGCSKQAPPPPKVAAAAVAAPAPAAKTPDWADEEPSAEVLRKLEFSREIQKLGHADSEFLEWAAQYDAGPKEGRSLAKHRAWLQERRCPVLELDGDMSVSERMAAVVAHMPGLRV